TAYHEAGHAAVALALGRTVDRVSIKANHLRLGWCLFGKGSFKPTKDLIETEILVLLAGLAAEARHTGRYSWGGADRDLRDVRAMTKLRAGGAGKQVERLERRMLDKTEHLLDDPAVWRAVEKIAAELIEKTTISGRAARHLFDRAAAEADAMLDD
ncbi:MAG: cell division protein FtsH, partial [Planctomycetia bacterium]